MLQEYGYDWKVSSCQRFLKSKLTEKYDTLLLFVTLEQNRPTIISIPSLESQPVSNLAALKQVAAILKDANTFVEKTSEVSWPLTINKLGKDSKRPPEIILNF